MKNEDQLSGFIQVLNDVLVQLDEMQLSVPAVKVAEAIDVLTQVSQTSARDDG
ncbi:hypothetical protein [Sphingorhabdus sp. 109]|jgi:hypothetical protein|uniref:hypothetical protein n=1 Tax=Sphingorhabdus sp. 109 TaxID=2653173 RepID=UPI00135C04D8|nr:hypothetical protein [Sphingorhabdus sp. 109]